MHVPCVGQSAHLVDPGSVGCAHCRGHWHRRHGHFVGHVHILRSQDVHCWLFVVMSAAHRNPDFRHVHLLRLLVVPVVGVGGGGIVCSGLFGVLCSWWSVWSRVVASGLVAVPGGLFWCGSVVVGAFSPGGDGGGWRGRGPGSSCVLCAV